MYGEIVLLSLVMIVLSILSRLICLWMGRIFWEKSCLFSFLVLMIWMLCSGLSVMFRKLFMLFIVSCWIIVKCVVWRLCWLLFVFFLEIVWLYKRWSRIGIMVFCLFGWILLLFWKRIVSLFLNLVLLRRYFRCFCFFLIVLFFYVKMVFKVSFCILILLFVKSFRSVV